MEISEQVPRLLAANSNGQRILDLRDGTVRLDLGTTSLRFTSTEFSTLVGMIEVARLRRDAPIDGLLAYDGTRCGIWRCPQYGTLALVVDRAIVRLADAETASFAAVCRKALTMLSRAGAPDCGKLSHTRN